MDGVMSDEQMEALAMALQAALREYGPRIAKAIDRQVNPETFGIDASGYAMGAFLKFLRQSPAFNNKPSSDG